MIIFRIKLGDGYALCMDMSYFNDPINPPHKQDNYRILLSECRYEFSDISVCNKYTKTEVKQNTNCLFLYGSKYSYANTSANVE